MQDLISQVEDLAGIEIDHTTSMVMIGDAANLLI